MTAAELIAALSALPPDPRVVLSDQELTTESEPAVMRLETEHVKPLLLAWADAVGIGWLEVAANGRSRDVVPGLCSGPRA